MNHRPDVVYTSDLLCEDQFFEDLKLVMYNHLLIYNHILDLTRSNSIDLSSHAEQLKKVKEFINTFEVKKYVASALWNELYYMKRKFLKDRKNEKQLTDIQYLTFRRGNKDLIIKGNTLTIDKISGIAMLPEDTNLELFNTAMFINISYSNNENRIKVKAFK